MYSQIFRSVRQQCRTVSKENAKFIHTCTYLLRKKTHYEVLEVKSNATAQDVKQAYYKLSKMYHPDRNKVRCEFAIYNVFYITKSFKDNPEAVEKFREVSASYEVLGNYNLRKLYDKGILHTAGGQYAHAAAREETEEDPQTRFYRMRMKRQETPQGPGETPVYDFDEWTKQHYGENFDKRQKAKQRRERQLEKELHRVNSLKLDRLIYVALFSIGVLMVLLPETYDTPKKIKRSE